MRTCLKILLAVLIVVAVGNTSAHADDSASAPCTQTEADEKSPCDLEPSPTVPWSVKVENSANAGSVAVTIYNTHFASVVTDCLAGHGTSTYAPPPASVDLIGGLSGSGIYIRYQIFNQPNGCQGILLLDTGYGPLLVDTGYGPGLIGDGAFVYPVQMVPSPSSGGLTRP